MPHLNLLLRTSALGNFRAMLEKVAKSPSMLHYLVNYTSSNGGPNENFSRELLSALAAFYTDLDGSGSSNYTQRLTVVVMSEFGRRLRENDDRGTDHGHGSFVLVMSGNALGGVKGTWPGLANHQLFDGADLAVTTDYRRVLSEILIRRLQNTNLGVVFPGYTGYEPLGVVAGADLPPVYGPEIFESGFESGDMSDWSTATS